MRGIPASVGATPRAILVISAHWREGRPTVTGAAAPALIYDYRAFRRMPISSKYPAPGDPALAAEVVRRLGDAGIEAGVDGVYAAYWTLCHEDAGATCCLPRLDDLLEG